MKKFSTRYLFILLAGLALTFCSDPVKVGDDSPQITIDAAWFDDVVDDDNDGFRSFARIYFQTSTTEPVNVFFRIGYKEAGSSSYFIYKETSEYSISESETWYVALGDAGYELPQGYYDFSVEIHMGEELVAILTSEDESNIASLGMEPASEELPAISIDQAWIDDIIDMDNDNYNSSAKLYFDITVLEEVTLSFVVGYKDVGTSTYYIYKEISDVSISTPGTWYIALGDDGNELAQGYYDFSLEVYYNSSLVDILTSEDEPDISNFGMEYPADDVQLVDLIFNNECPTSVLIDITGYGSLTVEGKSTNTYTFTGNPGTIIFNAQTQIPVGGNLAWTDRSVDLTGYTSYTFPNLHYTDTYFFTYITNNGGSSLSDFYVNSQLGESDWFYVNRSIPNDGVKREFGYYQAYPGTIIQVWSTGAQTWYEWNNLNYPGGDNQEISLTNSLAKSSASSNPKPNVNKKQRYFFEAP